MPTSLNVCRVGFTSPVPAARGVRVRDGCRRRLRRAKPGLAGGRRGGQSTRRGVLASQTPHTAAHSSPDMFSYISEGRKF